MNKYHSELHTVLDWLKDERCYQVKKFDYSQDDIAHIQEGFGEDSWLFQQVTNYMGRIRIFSLKTAQGRQAYMKLVATLVGLAEAMIHVYGLPPAPGYSSGDINDWNIAGKVYISGPMTGLPGKNFPTFAYWEEQIRELGLHPINPARNETIKADHWSDWMKTDLSDLLSCRAIFLMPGWEASKGATMEKELAEELSIPQFYSLEDLTEWKNSLNSLMDTVS